MLPKAVLSWVGRLVGIAAVVASPLVARAAEPSDGQSGKEAHKASSTSHPHAKTKARKKNVHKEHAGLAKSDAKPSTLAKPAPKDDPTDEAKSDKAAESAPEVIAEHASTRSVPKPSKTPLPTVAAAAVRPLLAVKARDAAPIEPSKPICKKTERHGHTNEKSQDTAKEDRGHAAEPRTTPILRASTLPEHAEPAQHVEHGKTKKTKPPCMNAAIEVTRGDEDESFSLTKCDGSVLPSAVDEMSVLVRPGSAARPQTPIEPTADKRGAKTDKTTDADKAEKLHKEEIAPGIKRIDARLVERIQTLVDHFAKPGKTSQLFVVSGYRPTSKGSFHATGRAIDFRLEGVENTDLVAFCKTLDDTGCGFYPNSSFIHMDVRDSGAGHVAWIDASSPGEKADYVAAWPPAPAKEDEADPVKLLARLDELEFLPKENASDNKPLEAEPGDDKAPETKTDVKTATGSDKSEKKAATATAKPECPPARGEEDAPAAVQKTRDSN